MAAELVSDNYKQLRKLASGHYPFEAFLCWRSINGKQGVKKCPFGHSFRCLEPFKTETDARHKHILYICADFFLNQYIATSFVYSPWVRR